MKEAIKIIKFFPERKFLHVSNEEKGWISLGIFHVAYHALCIKCSLIRGKNNNEDKSYFYFLELPCLRFKNKYGKWVKSNFFNFQSNNDSNEFQNTAFSIILEDYPHLFDEVFIKDRMNSKDKKEKDFHVIKARNKSKFIKGVK